MPGPGCPVSMQALGGCSRSAHPSSSSGAADTAPSRRAPGTKPGPLACRSVCGTDKRSRGRLGEGPGNPVPHRSRRVTRPRHCRQPATAPSGSRGARPPAPAGALAGSPRMRFSRAVVLACLLAALQVCAQPRGIGREVEQGRATYLPGGAAAAAAAWASGDRPFCHGSPAVVEAGQATPLLSVHGSQAGCACGGGSAEELPHRRPGGDRNQGAAAAGGGAGDDVPHHPRPPHLQQRDGGF